MGDNHFRGDGDRVSRVPKSKQEKEKKDFSPHFGTKPSHFINVPCSLDLPGQGVLTCTPKSPHLETLFASLAPEINQARPPRLCRVLMKRLIIHCFSCSASSLFRFAGIRETLERGKRQLLNVCVCYLPPWWGINCLLINEPFRAGHELGLRGGGERRGRKSAALLQPWCFLAAKKGLKSQKLDGEGCWEGREGRGRNLSPGMCQRREREKLKQQF